MKTIKQVLAMAMVLSSVSVMAEESALDAGGNAQGLTAGMQALIGVGSAVVLTGVVVSENDSDSGTP